MSVSPTVDALIVALDFEGEIKGSTLSGFAMILNFTNNRYPQSRVFSAGRHASCSFQHCNFKSRRLTLRCHHCFYISP